jgi:hypothetical protein
MKLPRSPPEMDEVPTLVTVSLPEDWISPPVMVRPEAEVIPPIDLIKMPPSKDEVAVPRTPRSVVKKSSVTERSPAKEEEAVEFYFRIFFF